MLDLRLLVMDVDGTLTDGKIYMGENGELFKAFDSKDGYALKEMLPKNNILPAIITGRFSQILVNRMNELEVTEIYQNIDDKKSCLLDLAQKHNLDLSQVAYIGDDLNDLECMKIAGFAACPANACKEVKELCDFVSAKAGGDGAVRETVEYLFTLP